MRKLIFSILIMSMAGFALQAQRFAFIDSDYILDNIPEYQAAQLELNELSKQWQTEIEAKFAEVEKAYREYQTEAMLLPEEMKVQKEEQIIAQEKEAKELQMQRFGREGDLFKKREELVKPIQDLIYTAIEDIATKGNYAIIFDKSAGGNMIYSDVRFDLSDQVLQQMGYRQ